jgi:hypothetical protein
MVKTVAHAATTPMHATTKCARRSSSRTFLALNMIVNSFLTKIYLLKTKNRVQPTVGLSSGKFIFQIKTAASSMGGLGQSAYQFPIYLLRKAGARQLIVRKAKISMKNPV